MGQRHHTWHYPCGFGPSGVRPAAAGLDRRVPGFYGALCRHCTLPRLGLYANYTGTAREKAAMRIAIGAFMYEANSFSPVQTTLDDFAAGTLVRGAAMLDYFRDTNTEVAGFLHSCAALPAAEIVPLLAADANPAGLVQAATYVALRDELLDRLARAQRTGPLDVVLLALHGAMVAEGEDDPEGAVLAAVRDIVGPEVPIAASLDLHANVTARMAAAADVLVGYRTYPHVDQRRTGERAAAPALAAAQGGPRPRTVVQKVPLIVPAETMQTTHGPMHEVRAEADWLEAEGAALAVSVFGMQPWLDLPEAGGSIVVVGTAAHDAHAHARRLARQLWQRRTAFDVPLVAPAAAVQRALTAERGPVLLVDSADSTSAGSPGDSVAVLQALLDAGCGRPAGSANAAGLCLVPLVDPPAAAAAHAAGTGATLTLTVGGTLDPAHSASVAVTGHDRAPDRRSCHAQRPRLYRDDHGRRTERRPGHRHHPAAAHEPHHPHQRPGNLPRSRAGAGHRAYRRGQIAQPLPRRLRTVRPGHHPARHARREQP